MKALTALLLALMPASAAEWPGGDTSLRPGADFFTFANGDWIRSNPIPADRSGFSIATIVSQQADARVRALVNDDAYDALPEPKDDRGKVGAYYTSFMDEPGIEARGIEPLRRALDKIDEAPDRTAIARLMGTVNDGFTPSLFDLSIASDTRVPDRNVLYLGAGGLGALDREVYIAPGSATVRAAYRTYIGSLLSLARQPSGSMANAILAFETELARITPTAVDRRNEDANYRPSTTRDLNREAPGFPWDTWFAGARVSGDRRVILTDRTAIPAFARLFATTPLPVLKGWMAFHLTDGAAPFLPRNFSGAHFAFHDGVVAGKMIPPPRWQTAIRLVSGPGWKDTNESRRSMGDAVGRLYTARWFDPQARDELRALVTNLQTVLKERIAASEWMSASSRREALLKVSSIRIDIGVPDRSDGYGGLVIRRDDLFGNAERASAFAWSRELSSLDGAVDRRRWTITPQTVNAYNYAPFNQVVFTAALLQPPAFDPSQDRALAYGGIGAIIGHELTHGFDDVGRHYDASGRRRDWWTGPDTERFDAKSKALTDLFSACEPAPGLHVDGKLTLGENIADIGGLQLAYAAYHASLGGRPAPVVNGLSGDQRFFLGFAMLRRGHRRIDALRNDVATDPHTPDRCRVNEDVRQLDAWYGAFGIKPNDPLYLPPSRRVSIW